MIAVSVMDRPEASSAESHAGRAVTHQCGQRFNERGRIIESRGHVELLDPQVARLLPVLDIEPREEKEFTLSLPKITPEPGAEYWLNVSFGHSSAKM